MPVIHRCALDHVWSAAGPCPVCGSQSTNTGDGSTQPGARKGDTFAGKSSRQTNLPFPSIPEYTIQAEIGAEGMGVVYRATHVSLGREVALKVIRSGEMAQDKDQKRKKALRRRALQNLARGFKSLAHFSKSKPIKRKRNNVRAGKSMR